MTKNCISIIPKLQNKEAVEIDHASDYVRTTINSESTNK